MEYNDDEQKLEFIKDSAGSGQGAWFLSRFLFWGKTLKKSIIALDKTKRELDRLFGFFSWLFIFSGFASLLVWLYLNLEGLLKEPIDILFFWSDPTIFITI